MNPTTHGIAARYIATTYRPPLVGDRVAARAKARERLRDGPAVTWQGPIALVPSASTAGKRYRVAPDERCTCDANAHSLYCWHLAARSLLIARGHAPAGAQP